jgi:hypothetical protein
VGMSKKKLERTSGYVQKIYATNLTNTGVSWTIRENCENDGLVWKCMSECGLLISSSRRIGGWVVDAELQ